MNAGKIETLLAELRAERATLDVAIEALEKALGTISPETDTSGTSAPNLSPPVSGVTSSEIPRNAFYGMTVPEAVVSYLSVTKRKQTAREIFAALRAGGLHTNSKNLYSGVYTALVRLERAGQVGKFGREWGLSAWFPGAGRKKGKAAESGGSNGDDD